MKSRYFNLPFDVEGEINTFTSELVSAIGEAKKEKKEIINLSNFLFSLTNFQKSERDNLHTFYCIDSSDIACHCFELDQSFDQFSFGEVIFKDDTVNRKTLEAFDKLFLGTMLFDDHKNSDPLFLLKPYRNELEGFKLFFFRKVYDSILQNHSSSDIRSKNKPTGETCLLSSEDIAEIKTLETALKTHHGEVPNINERVFNLLARIAPELNEKFFTDVYRAKSILAALTKLTDANNLYSQDTAENEITAENKTTSESSVVRDAKNLFLLIDEIDFSIPEQMLTLLVDSRGSSEYDATRRDIEAVVRVHLLNVACESQDKDFRFQLITRTPFFHRLFSKVNTRISHDIPIHPLFIPSFYAGELDKTIKKPLAQIENKVKVLSSTKNEEGESNLDETVERAITAASEACTLLLTYISPKVWDIKYTKSQQESLLSGYLNDSDVDALSEIMQVVRKEIDSGSDATFLRDSLTENLMQQIDSSYIVSRISSENINCEIVSADIRNNLPTTIRFRTGKMRVPLKLYSSLCVNSQMDIESLLKRHGYSKHVLATKSKTQIYLIRIKEFFQNLLSLEIDNNISSCELNDVNLLKASLLASETVFDLSALLLSTSIKNCKKDTLKLINTPEKELFNYHIDNIPYFLSIKELYTLRQYTERSSAFDFEFLYRRDAVKNFRRAERDLGFTRMIDAKVRAIAASKGYSLCYQFLSTDPRVKIGYYSGYLEHMFKAWTEGDSHLSTSDNVYIRSEKISDLRMSKDLWFLQNEASEAHRDFTVIMKECDKLRFMETYPEAHISQLEFLGHRLVQLNLLAFCIALSSNQITPMHSLWKRPEVQFTEHLDFVNLQHWSDTLNTYNNKYSVKLDRVIPQFKSTSFITCIVEFFLQSDRSKDKYQSIVKKIEECIAECSDNRNLYVQLMHQTKKQFESRISMMKC